MNLVDSCGWLEYFADGPNADFFVPAIENLVELGVPSLCLFEVFKRVLSQRGEGDAFQAVAVMKQARVIDLDTPLALSASSLSARLSLPMADSVVRAHPVGSDNQWLDAWTKATGVITLTRCGFRSVLPTSAPTCEGQTQLTVNLRQIADVL